MCGSILYEKETFYFYHNILCNLESGDAGVLEGGKEEEGETTTDLYYTIITDYDFSVQPKYKAKSYNTVYNTEVILIRYFPSKKKSYKANKV